MGLLLKEAQDLWPISCDVACASELCSQGASGSAWTDVVGRYASLTAHVQELGLQECWKLKPLLNGQAVMKRVGVPQVRPERWSAFLLGHGFLSGEYVSMALGRGP